jgi:hypothetical protein
MRTGNGKFLEHLVLKTSGTVVTNEKADTSEHIDDAKPTKKRARRAGTEMMIRNCTPAIDAHIFKYIFV